MDWDSAQLSEIASQAAHEVLLWVGFGTLTGLTAKAVMPGRDPGGAVATVMMGIAGSVIGCATMLYFFPGQTVTPVSAKGFLLASAGAFVLLFFNRVFTGGVVDEAGSRGLFYWWRMPRWSRRRRVATRA